MGFFSSLFGKSNDQSDSSKNFVAPITLAEEVKRQIETTEGELHDAMVQREHSSDPEIRASLDLLVARKTQALKDLEEKLKNLK